MALYHTKEVLKEAQEYLDHIAIDPHRPVPRRVVGRSTDGSAEIIKKLMLRVGSLSNEMMLCAKVDSAGWRETTREWLVKQGEWFDGDGGETP